MSELFTPHLTPAAMLTIGVFGKAYFQNATPADLEGLPDDVLALVPANRGPFSKGNNAYGAKAGLDLRYWQEAGWIFDEDPLGWFHWYCRYHAGRRHERDEHQIARWVAYGERWGAQARWQQRSNGDASRTVKQGLLQWAYSPVRILTDS